MFKRNQDKRGLRLHYRKIVAANVNKLNLSIIDLTNFWAMDELDLRASSFSKQTMCRFY
jgi:hypothetical protein